MKVIIYFGDGVVEEYEGHISKKSEDFYSGSYSSPFGTSAFTYTGGALDLSMNYTNKVTTVTEGNACA